MSRCYTQMSHSALKHKFKLTRLLTLSSHSLPLSVYPEIGEPFGRAGCQCSMMRSGLTQDAIGGANCSGTSARVVNFSEWSDHSLQPIGFCMHKRRRGVKTKILVFVCLFQVWLVEAFDSGCRTCCRTRKAYFVAGRRSANRWRHSGQCIHCF